MAENKKVLCLVLLFIFAARISSVGSTQNHNILKSASCVSASILNRLADTTLTIEAVYLYTMSDYKKKLANPLWQKKRLEILNRDNWACQWCANKEMELHVHHTFYEKGKEPWEYEDYCLITLCKDCHDFTRLNLTPLEKYLFEIVKDRSEGKIELLKRVVRNYVSGATKFEGITQF